MEHHTSRKFRERLEASPEDVRDLARKRYELLKKDPRHPSLHFKRVGRFWSVRVNIDYRAVGVDLDGGVLWFWIGPHAEYDAIIKS